MKYFDQRSQLMLELGVPAEALSRIQTYIDLLWKSNEELNLISRKMTYEELIDNHLIDCLLPLKFFPKDAIEVADFGSGGGLPGVLYAIIFTKVKYHLFEKSPKKQEFLQSCRSIAPNLQVHGDIPLDLKNIDLVTARAFKPVDVILDMSRNYYKNKGSYFLLKARLEKIQEETDLAKKKFKDLDQNIQVVKLHSPILDVERNLVLINNTIK